MIDCLVVGGGPAGLSAAAELARLGARARVVDREATLGGIPRHCHHTGFGLLDLRRLLTGPRYAQRRVDQAGRAGATLSAETTAIEWLPGADGPGLLLSSPGGLERVRARTILLATGCRERPRAARLVPGSRPLGVYTTGSLQQLAHGHGRRIGSRAVVIGAEHVSFSAVETLVERGVDVVAMLTEHAAHQSYALLRLWVERRRGIPLLCGHRVAAIEGQRRVEAVVVEGPAGRRRLVCDTAVFTGAFTPDHELARAGGLAMDRPAGAPRTDALGRSSVPGVFAAGNLVHAAEIADRAALSGQAAARAIARHLDQGGRWPRLVPIECVAPLEWVSPSSVSPGETAPPHGAYLLRARSFVDRAIVEAWQGERLLERTLVGRLVPNRSAWLDAGFSTRVRGEAPIVLRVAGR